MLTKGFLAAILFAPFALSYPSSDGSPDPALLFKRDDATSDLGDFTGQTSSYQDGSGTYMESKDVHYYASGVKCWTDIVSLLLLLLEIADNGGSINISQFYVTNEYQAQNWTPMKENTIDCSRTSICASSSYDAIQNCGSWSITWGNDVKVELMNKIGLEIKETIDNTWLKSHCTTATVQNTCTWNDQLCHALWTSSVVQNFHGYIRRRCSGGRSGWTKKPDYTAWSHDYSWTQPSPQTRLGCGALCDQTSYPGPVPPA
ncbi:MAG: hypothetical protein OHK93_008021 [Ramalina farinacea]|uniref:Uncharacterized protein n=1 Tax=Ramalina farinacea TaxID=258253 RepID=A0AA43TW57_9LECA|nr:hypothetical protein [Ramalina farinacea]